MGNAGSTVSSRVTTDFVTIQDREMQERGFLQLRSTHDASTADEHIPYVEKFVSDLQEALDAIRSTPNGTRYIEVHVLFLSWKDDTLGVMQEINELESVLSKLYRFTIHRYDIHGEKPGRDTQSRVTQFLLENDSRDHLLILYYAGHAMSSRQGSEAPIWAATDRNGTPTVAAGGIQALFEEADSDVLLLYDCCHSAHPAVTVSGHGVTEVIAASGFETQTPMPGRTSFTHALIRALTESCHGPPFSVAKLHEMVLRSLKSSTRDYLKDDHGDVWTDPQGRPVLQRQPTSTPIHCFLTEERPHRGILLSPLPTRLDPAGSISSMDSGKASSAHLGDNASASVSQASSATDILDANSITPTNVLLSIRVDQDYFKEDREENIWRWREWIRNIPPEAKGVKIEAIYESFSTLVLISIPVTLWNLLSDNPAYSFVGFITSTNKVLTFEQEDEAGAERKVIDTVRKNMQTTRDEHHPRHITSRINTDLLSPISEDERDLISEQPSEWDESKREKRKDDNLDWQASMVTLVEKPTTSQEAEESKIGRLHDAEKLLGKNQVLDPPRKKGARIEGHQAILEEVHLDVEVLRQKLAEKEEVIRLAERRVADNNRTILYLKNCLRTHGFRVED